MHLFTSTASQKEIHNTYPFIRHPILRKGLFYPKFAKTMTRHNKPAYEWLLAYHRLCDEVDLGVLGQLPDEFGQFLHKPLAALATKHKVS